MAFVFRDPRGSDAARRGCGDGERAAWAGAECGDEEPTSRVGARVERGGERATKVRRRPSDEGRYAADRVRDQYQSQVRLANKVSRHGGEGWLLRPNGLLAKAAWTYLTCRAGPESSCSSCAVPLSTRRAPRWSRAAEGEWSRRRWGRAGGARSKARVGRCGGARRGRRGCSRLVRACPRRAEGCGSRSGSVEVER